MKLIVYGDFNCPYSALASARVDRLLEMGAADVEWRAVQHDAEMPVEGRRVDGELRAELTREMDEIRGLLRDGESFDIELPVIRPNTAEASRSFAGSPTHDLRRKLFSWAWDAGAKPGADVQQDAETAARWQREWDAMEKKTVPTLVLPDSYISRGLGALKRLADMVESDATSDTRT